MCVSENYLVILLHNTGGVSGSAPWSKSRCKSNTLPAFDKAFLNAGYQ